MSAVARLWMQMTNKKAPTDRGFDAARQKLHRGSDLRHVNGVLAQSALDGKRNLAINQRKQSVILADADIDTGVKTRTALANNNAASVDHFTAEFFDAQHLRL